MSIWNKHSENKYFYFFESSIRTERYGYVFIDPCALSTNKATSQTSRKYITQSDCIFFLLFRLNGTEKLSVYITMIQYNVANKYLYTNTGKDHRKHASSRLIMKYFPFFLFWGYIVSCDYISIVLTDVVIEKPHRKMCI